MRSLFLATLGLGILASAAHADDGAWEVRIRALQISPLTETHDADLRNAAQLSVHHATRFCARGSTQFYDWVEGDSARRVAAVSFRVWPVAGCIA